MIDWDDLKHFVAVARHGSTLAAAKALGVSQSTVHRRLTTLEQRLGCSLVTRHSTGYRLTELGVALQAEAERVEEAVAAFERRLAAADTDLVGTVRVTCPEPLVIRITESKLLDRFRARYPGLRIEFVMGDRYLDLARGEADVAIRAGDLTDDRLIARKLTDSPWGVFGSRRYVEGRGCPSCVADLNQHAVIALDGPMIDHRAACWLRRVAPDARIAARNNSIPGLLYAVKSGMGVAPLPMALGAEHDLICVLGPVPELATSWHLLTHPDLRRTPRVRAFVEFIVEEIDAVRPILLGRPVPTPDDATV